jgi:hypothetical protein
MSRSLEAMADWLVESGVTLAGMESTATYRKPVSYAPQDRMGTWLLNARIWRRSLAAVTSPTVSAA